MIRFQKRTETTPTTFAGVGGTPPAAPTTASIDRIERIGPAVMAPWTIPSAP